ncbi:MAG TPA: amidase family protein [Vicinamibacterales bacterium]|jgi:amidase|nr:amidase family protein [Vicinamibacterales bacterium]
MSIGDDTSRRNGITRRVFLGAGAASGAVLLSGRIGSLFTATISAAADQPWIESGVPELQAMMASGALTSRALTLGYLDRIRTLNPLLAAVIETNSQAVGIAAQLDAERRAGFIRGPLHGIPILVKDNIATSDTMQTTAGSLALVNSTVPADAPIVARLRAAGAVILGKANLSEWANFRGFAPFNGWSARGGFTRDPYLLSFDPCGSSSGSAVAAAANLCAAAVGTETDGSVVCPSGNNLVVGIKPSLPLLSQDGIVPIGHSQDTAGPIARTVTDAAILLGVMQTPGIPGVPSTYTPFLQRGALAGRVIGVDSRYFTEDYGGEPDLVAVAQQGIAALSSLGATVIEVDTGDSNAYFDDEFTVLLSEFKVQIAEYLATLRHTQLRTLRDLIDFNIAHCPAEMKYFGQELFELADSTSGDLTDPVYLAARANSAGLARSGIDTVLQSVDAIVAPTYSFASTPAAVAGYPNISIPIGLTPEGKPAGLWMYAGLHQEAKLIAFAFDLEQAVQPRRAAQFLGSVPPEPPDAGICEALPSKPHVFTGKAHLPRHLGTGKPIKG